MDWTKVVTNPLGLSGFALSLFFGGIGFLGARQRRWVAPVAALMAGVALVGGLFLSHEQIKNSAAQIESGSQATGTGSVAVTNSKVQGGINVNVKGTNGSRLRPPSDAALPQAHQAPGLTRSDGKVKSSTEASGTGTVALTHSEVQGGIYVHTQEPNNR